MDLCDSGHAGGDSDRSSTFRTAPSQDQVPLTQLGSSTNRKRPAPSDQPAGGPTRLNVGDDLVGIVQEQLVPTLISDASPVTSESSDLLTVTASFTAVGFDRPRFRSVQWPAGARIRGS